MNLADENTTNMTLNKENKVAVLKEVLHLIENEYEDFMCVAIREVFKKHFNVKCIYNLKMEEYETFTNYKKWFKTLRPKNTDSVAWWPNNFEGKQKRIVFLKAQIKKLS